MLNEFLKKEAPIQGLAGMGGGVPSRLLTLASGEVTYVDDVFSIDLWDGDGASTRTITNGIDLSGEGGMVWGKTRSTTVAHVIADTERGVSKNIYTNTTDAEDDRGAGNGSVDQFNSDGFAIGNSNNFINYSGHTACSWTFRKCPGFFDVVTWTTTTDSAEQIPHNLGSTPGMIIVKRTDSTSNWIIWHRSLSNSLNDFLRFDTSDKQSAVGVWGNNAPNSTHFEYDSGAIGREFVAYVFAHNDGSFGEDSDEAVIKCGSYSGASGATTVDLGFEPQFVIIKRTNGTGNWNMLDNMRGLVVGGNDQNLWPNLADAESSLNYVDPTATGFILPGDQTAINASGNTYIYIAIRRPHKPPESATEVFKPFSLSAGEGQDTFISTGFDVDTFIYAKKSNSLFVWGDRLRGQSGGGDLLPSSTAVEDTNSGSFFLDHSGGVTVDFSGGHNYSAPAATDESYVRYFFRRAPGFFDAVAYSGGSSAQNISHNLTVKPEMIITKNRTTSDGWAVQHSALGATKRIRLSHEFSASTNSGYWNDTEPTASVFTVGTDKATGQSGSDYIGWLFASLAGISKVGSYTGTGSNIDVDCGFTAGARFVLIKRSDATADWYVYDSARGIVGGNDPYLLFNEGSTAEVTNTDYIDPLNAGFTVTSSAPAGLNASGGSYIFLAIA